MLDQNDIGAITDRDVYGSDGDKIGTARQVYADDETGKPEWVTVRTGLFGTNESFVPLADASMTTDGITVPYSKSFVKDAPNMSEDGHLSPDQERELYAYYSRGEEYDRRDLARDTDASVTATSGVDRDDQRRDDQRRDDQRRDDQRRDATVGGDASGQTTDDAMTVSEERLNVGTERREAGRARLRKYVVTENVTQTVPVQREEVRLEREPITADNSDAALSGPDISEDEHEVVLHEERPVVETEAVPVERVRLGTETVTEEQTVSQDVRREEVDVEGDVDRNDRV